MTDYFMDIDKNIILNPTQDAHTTETDRLTPDACSLKPIIFDLKPEACRLKPIIFDLKPEACSLKPNMRCSCM